MTAAEDITTGVSKLHSQCLGEILDENSFSEDFINFLREFMDIEKKRLDFSKNIAAELTKLLFLCPGNTWRKTSLPENKQFFHFFFGLWAQDEKDFGLELLACVLEMNFPCPEENF